MNVLRWLAREAKFEKTLGFYNELARKFLFESKLSAAQYLLSTHLQSSLSAAQKASLKQLVSDMNLMLVKSTMDEEECDPGELK